MDPETQHPKPSTPPRRPPVEVIATAAPADPAAATRVRVLCVDDSPDIARMLARIIGGEPDLEDAGVLHSAQGIVDKVLRRRVDVVVLDLTMPGPDPIAAIRALAERVPACRVIAFSGYDDDQTRDEVRRAGAWGLVSKSGEPGDIVTAIRRATKSGPIRPI